MTTDGETIKPSLPVHFVIQPIEPLVFKENDKAKYITFGLKSDYITTNCVQRTSSFASMHFSIWQMLKNDIELLKFSTDKEKILFEYCYDRDISDDKIDCNLANLYPLPIEKTIYLPHVDAENISIDNNNIGQNTGDDRVKIVSVKLCDVKNNSKHGPMLVIEICNINDEKVSYSMYCQHVLKNIECNLFQVYIPENKPIIFKFPDWFRDENVEKKMTKRDNHIFRYRHIYVGILLGICIYCIFF